MALPTFSYANLGLQSSISFVSRALVFLTYQVSCIFFNRCVSGPTSRLGVHQHAIIGFIYYHKPSFVAAEKLVRTQKSHTQVPTGLLFSLVGLIFSPCPDDYCLLRPTVFVFFPLHTPGSPKRTPPVPPS